MSSALLATARWLEQFLAKPHPTLGRAGLVCPFVPRALRMETIQMVEVSTQELNQTELEALVKNCRETFLNQFPQQGNLATYKALLLIFPDIPNEQCGIVDQVQQKLKPFFVEKGLMLGEFHRFNQSPGLHNPDFRPLQSPVPMLAIRFMTEADLPFLSRTTDSPEMRVEYLAAYLDHMSAVGIGTKLPLAQQALIKAKYQLQSSDETGTGCPIKRLTTFVTRRADHCLQWALHHLLLHGWPKRLWSLMWPM
ncbi:MAG: DUF6875 domain-containing protein [Leptolyngbyaceae cyanobacterium]